MLRLSYLPPLMVYAAYGVSGLTGIVGTFFVKDYLDEDLNQYTFLVAGPPAMVEGVQGALQEAGVRDENLIAQRYSGY